MNFKDSIKFGIGFGIGMTIVAMALPIINKGLQAINDKLDKKLEEIESDEENKEEE